MWVLRHCPGATVLVALLFSSPSGSAAPLAPLGPEARAIVAAIPTDPAPSKLVEDRHYLVSNEVYPERFREALADLGGAFVGVGPEQNYFYAGWAKPELLILIDFDDVVVALHGVYQAFFRAAADSGSFVALWGDDQEPARQAMRAAADGPGELARLEHAYGLARSFVRARLEQARKRYTVLGLPTFLTDATQYQDLVALVAAGRVRTLRGDLTGKRTMNGIAAALRKLGLPARAIYLSNSEQYFDYDGGARANLMAQPVDERSLVLRTFFVAAEPADQYRYYLQSALDLRGWLELSDLHNIVKLLERARPTRQGASWLVPGPRAAARR